MVSAVDWMKDTYRKEYERNPVFTLFLTILIVFFVVFVIAAIITGGDSFYNTLFRHREDTFMDYFNSIVYSADRPYTHFRVIYPPLITGFYAVIGNFTIPFVTSSPGYAFSLSIRDSQMGMMSFVVITLITFYLLRLVFSKIVKEKGTKKELMFLLLVLLSFPFINALERGNSIILALVFCFLFLLGYRSENKIIRYLSYIALGVAAGIKLYPAILWLLIVRDRKYREAGICMAIVTALLIVPFIFTDGNPITLLNNAFSYAGSNIGYTNINQIVTNIFQVALGFSEGIVNIISYAVIGIFTLLSFIVILFDKKMKHWKIIALIACNLVLGLGVGTMYQIIYMTMPILYFLATEKEMTRENTFYVVCFAMTMVLIPGIIIFGIHPREAIATIESAFVILAAIAIIYEGLKRVYRNRFGHGRDAEENTLA